MIILSIDIGIVNFCFSVEEYPQATVLKLENTRLATSGRKVTTDILNKITKIIQDQFSEFNIELVLIEKQVHKNINAIRIMQHVWTLINILYPTVKLELYPSKYKTQVFGQKFDNYTKRKKWSVMFAKNLMTERNDLVTFEKLSCKKADDMADCILMSYSWFTKNS